VARGRLTCGSTGKTTESIFRPRRPLHASVDGVGQLGCSPSSRRPPLLKNSLLPLPHPTSQGGGSVDTTTVYKNRI